MKNKVWKVLTGISVVAVILSISLMNKPWTDNTVIVNDLNLQPTTKPIDNTIKEPTTINTLTTRSKPLNVSPDKDIVLELNGVVQSSTVRPLINKLRQLDKTGKPIYLLINSPGGSVIDGASLVSQMESMKSPVYTVCTQLCASMAAIIHQYGVKRYVVNRSILMFHPASGGAQGQVKNMKSRINFIDKFVDKFNEHIVSKIKLSKNEYLTAVAYELWVDSDDALTDGFADAAVSLDVETAAPPPEFEERNFNYLETLRRIN